MSAEEDRLRALYDLDVLDSGEDQRFDQLATLAAELFDAPIAAITLIDRDRFWLKSRIGIEGRSGPRDASFCAHLTEPATGPVLVVPDAAADARFADYPAVTGDMHLRFYAGAVLLTPEGQRLGALCVAAKQPREVPDPRQLATLQLIADIAVDELGTRRRLRQHQEREALLGLAGSMSGVGCWSYDVLTREVTWSDEVHAIHGVTRDTFTPTLDNALSFYPQADRLAVERLLTEAIRSGEGYDFELTLNRADGARRHVVCKATCLLNAAREVVRVSGVFQDVTTHIEARRCIEDSEAKFRLLTEFAGDMVSRTGPDGRLHYVSPASLRVLGVPAAELLRRGLLHLVDPRDRAAVMNHEAGLLRAGMESGTVTFRVTSEPGPQASGLWIETTSQALCDPQTGVPDGFVSISRNITDRQAALEARILSEQRLQQTNAELERVSRHLSRARDQADESNKAKSRFLTAISHELRTPLNGILGYAQLLRMEGTLTPLQAARVESMLGAGEHLLGLINSVLGMAEIETGHIVVRAEQVELETMARSCLDLVRPAAEKKWLALSLALEPGCPAELVTDLTRLRQVLLNLLGNAIKYTDAGLVSLRIRRLGEHVRFEVVDTGPGIPPAARRQLFKDFERLGTTHASPVEGAGLGLAISKRLVDLLGGQLGHEDNPQGGSIFWLELPPTRSDAQPRAASSFARTRLHGAQSGGARVLVVDDMAMNRDVAASFLRAAKYVVTTARDGEEAVALATEHDFDVVLMDVRMPGTDGLEATRRIRALAAPRGDVPVVALTAQSFAAQIEQCREAGMDTHLAKPFTCEALIAVVEEALASRVGQPGAPTRGASPPPPADAPPVFDLDAFRSTTAYLSPTAVRDYMGTLVERAEDLLRDLRAPDAARLRGDNVTQATHILAGSAGMFGFRFLVAAARDYEAVAEDPVRSARAGAALAKAIEQTLPQLRDQAVAA